MCVIATLGFDVDFIIRRLSRGLDVSRLVCIGLRADEYGWKRVERAFNLINFYCQSTRVTCILESIGVESAISEFRSIVERELRSTCTKVELYLTGGPRLAVISAVLASLMLSEDLGERVLIVVEGEAFEARLEVPIGVLRRVTCLGDLEKKILLEASRRPIRPSELARTLGLHKPTVYRKVRALAEANLLSRVQGVEEEYVAVESVQKVFKLIGQL